MSIGLLLDSDALVAEKLFASYGQAQYKYDKCLGLVHATRGLVGAALLHNWNGSNVELSYYGENTLSCGVIRCLARYIVCTFDPSRLTVTVGKRRKRFQRALMRLGFRLEGTQRCYYGKRDCTRNTGIRFVMFRVRLDELARTETIEAKAAQSC